MVCQCRFILGSKCTTLASDADNGGGCACVGSGGIWEISEPSPQLCCESKTALKNIKPEKRKQRDVILYFTTFLWACEHSNTGVGTSLVVQWLRIRLPMQRTRVRALVREDPTCRRATKPVCHRYWACALEPASHNYWAWVPRACAPQQEKPPQWEARTPQLGVAPAHRN